MFFNTSLTDQALQGSCRFMDGKRRAAVGLVSFMGSGNTWVRGLLEIATGYCTGIYIYIHVYVTELVMVVTFPSLIMTILG